MWYVTDPANFTKIHKMPREVYTCEYICACIKKKDRHMEQTGLMFCSMFWHKNSEHFLCACKLFIVISPVSFQILHERHKRKTKTTNDYTDFSIALILALWRSAYRGELLCSNAYGRWFAPRTRHSVRMTYTSNAALQLLRSLIISHNKSVRANK